MAASCPPAVGEARFASLDAAFYGTEEDYNPDPRSMARRSISIFSRRGTETPEPKPPFIAQAAMPSLVMPKRQMTEKQKSWMKRTKSASGGKSPKAQAPKGTILNAVPPAMKIQMSKLEEEMATSPNEEILSAVSEQSPMQLPSPSQQHGFWNRSSISLGERTKSQKKRDTNSRIGTWVNGVAQWTDEVRHQRYGSQDSDVSIESETGFTPVHPVVSGRPPMSRPALSVLIPGNEPRVNDRSLSTIVQPRPQRPLVSVAPASIVSKFAMQPPEITIEVPPRDVSPLEPPSDRPATPPRRKHAPDHLIAETPLASRPRASRTSSSTTTSSSLERDDTSVYSKRSSATSVEPVQTPTSDEEKRLGFQKRKPLSTYSLVSPGEAGVFDDATDPANKPLPRIPEPTPARAAPAPPSSPTSQRPQTSRSTKSAPGGRRAELLRPKPKVLKPTRSLTQLDLFDQEFMRTSPYGSDVSEPTSPTLSQAENDLQAQLSNINEESNTLITKNEAGLTKSASVRRTDSVRSVMHPPERAPTVPRRSRKRDWRKSTATKHIASQVMLPAKSPARRKSESALRQAALAVEDLPPMPRLRKSLSASEMPKMLSFAQHLRMASEKRLSVVAPLPGPPRIFIDDGLCVVEGPVIVRRFDEEMEPVSSASAEEVLLHILACLTNLDDLESTAMINKGMYRVYKENEMHLIKTVSHNQSPAAWELREWSPPDRNEVGSSKASSQLEHTPMSYMRCHRRDIAVIESLKKLILAQCQTFIRRETAFALSTPQHPNAQRFNDAFWRIWCFCKIFGCEKGREEDVTGQLDWLKGGLLANNQGCVATVNTNLDFEMTSILLNPPEQFAKGNMGGLNAQQLYDMTELWTCLSALLGSYQNHVDQARRYGVFDDCDVAEGDVEREEHMVEEWTSYLLTLGPAVVLEMAEYACDGSSAGFAIAKENGWTKWSPSVYNGSRSTFLKEPVARLYQERVAAAALALQNPKDVEKKEMSRKRVASLAAEIRLRRQTSGYKRLPLIDMSMERPMSVMSRRDSVASVRSNRSSITITRTASHSPKPGPNFSQPRPMSPNGWSPRKISPIIEGRVETFNRMSLNNLDGLADATAERAVQKIVDMGFNESEAKKALRVTDMGDGLRVDRAVDLLLRQR